MNKTILLAIAIAFTSFSSVLAQKLKFGHINTMELMASLPEMQSVQTEGLIQPEIDESRFHHLSRAVECRVRQVFDDRA